MNDWKSEIGWVGFYNKAHTDFSESFKRQFSTQLEYAFNAMTEIDNYAEVRGFLVLVGMEEMQLSYKDGFGFGVLELITPYSESVPQTFFWKTKDVENTFKRDDFNEDNIKIGFCVDFKKDFFRNFRKRKAVRTLNGTKLKFKYIEELDLYPDQSISIEFESNPLQSEIEELRSELQKCLVESFVSDANLDENIMRIALDFQGTEFNNGKKQLRQFVIYLNNSNYEIKTVCVE